MGISQQHGMCAPLASALLALIGCLSARPVVAQSDAISDADKLTHFERRIRPALTQYCFECHSSDTESNGGLALDSRLGWEVGGDSGPAIVAGEPEASRLLKAIRYDDSKMQMPPDKRLPPDIVAAFEKWIADGAIDPRDGIRDGIKPKSNSDTSAAQAWWSYQPINSPEIPASDQSQTRIIDRFINAKLAAAGITPAPMAERRELIRRLSFDLTGLPPEEQLVSQLETSDDFDAAYQAVVDRWLSSPAYGEAMARRWMDVARYAESVTLRGLVFKEAWRYRDYLVHSFAEDRPFDLMIREQIAGDLMYSENQAERWRQLVATTFLAMGNTNFEEQDKQQLEMDYVDEQLDVIGQAFLGQTIACARCHDHKFDPIPTQDYYALAGILKSAVALRHSNVSNWVDHPLPLPMEQEQHFASIDAEVAKVAKELAAKKKLVAALAKKNAQNDKSAKSTTSDKGTSTGKEASKEPAKEPVKSIAKKAAKENTNSDDVDVDPEALASEMKLLEAQQKELQQKASERPKYLTVVEEAAPADIAVHIRGDVHNLGPIVPRGFLSAIEMREPIEIGCGESGRMQLARWLTARENPLTARVYANRIWTWMMGQGIVDTPNNFGTTGSLPSHPELLDFLASQIVKNGWSTKQLVREIVLSDAYRRKAIEATSEIADVDPDNRLYWSGPRRRLSAEELRDAMLLASGELDVTPGGATIKPGTGADYGYNHTSSRRSLYQPVFRNALPQLFEAFDFAAPSVSIGQRSRSTVATQALSLMNEPWVYERARALAKRIRDEHPQASPETWIEACFETTLQRKPTYQELTICLEFFTAEEPSQHDQQLEQLAHAIFASIDFRYLR